MHPEGRAALLAMTLSVAGCLQVPEAHRTAPVPQDVAVAARDARGEAVALDALPRRPLIEVSHPRGFADLDAIALVSGSADQALLADLSDAPLRQEHATRSVPVDAVLHGSEIQLTPRAALQPAADYMLAVFGNAKAADADALFDDRAPYVVALRTSGAADAGAAPTRTFPADRATGVAVNLSAAVIAFDGEVLGAQEGVWLEDATNRAVAARVEDGRCAVIAPAFAANAEHCARIIPRDALSPLADYALVVGAAARDARGGAVGPLRTRFRTGTGRDSRAPVTLTLACALDEQQVEPGCALVDDHAVRLRMQADEPMLAELAAEGSAQDAANTSRAVTDQGELELGLSGLLPDTATALTLSLTDGAGNARVSHVVLRTTPALATISIDELRADPLGPEPAQEYVELHNYGRSPVELLGLALTDDVFEPGVAIDRVLRLDPGGRALLVGSAFDARDTRDGALPRGVTLLRAPGAIAGSGLSNAGETLVLRDAQGRRLSGAPATPKPRPGLCLQRVGDDPRDTRPEAFAYDLQGGCTPGF